MVRSSSSKGLIMLSKRHSGWSDEVKKRSVWALCQRFGLHIRQQQQQQQGVDNRSKRHSGRSDEVKKLSFCVLCQRGGLHIRHFSLLITSENHQVKAVWKKDNRLPWDRDRTRVQTLFERNLNLMARKKLGFEGLTRKILVKVAYIKFTHREIESWNDLSIRRLSY